jgi:hypothetical protein
MGAGELAAEEFEEAAGARATVGAQEAHAVEEDKELESFGVFRMAERGLRWRLFGFGEEGGQGIVEGALNGGGGTPLVDNAGGECFIGFGEGSQGGENVWIRDGGLAGAKFCNGEGDGGKKLRMQADEIGSEADIQQWSIRGERARMIFFVAVSGEEIGAIRWAVERDFAFGAAAHGADFFGFGGAEAFGLAFLADGTGHGAPGITHESFGRKI